MHPVLFRIGPLQFRAYGLALAVSFLVGSWLALKRGRARGYGEDLLLSLFAWIVAAAVVGARLHFVLAHPEDFPGPLDALRLWEGGMTLYGGLIGAILASWLFLRRNRTPFLGVADVVAPSLALGEAITRIGCFVNGCCFGRPCDGALCVRYPADSYAAAALGSGVEVFPAQLFLSAGFLLATVLLLKSERRLGAPGALFGLYLVLQGLLRWGIDFFRWYEPIDRIPALAPLIGTKSQLVAALLLVAGAALLLRGWRASSAAARERVS